MSTIDRPKTAVPLLVAGQRLNQAEFHSRYEAMPPGTRAELIGGVVYMPSPVGHRHSTRSANVVTWLNLYRSRTPGVEVGNNASTVLDDSGEPQPDALLRIAPDFGGQTHNAGNFIGGAPELVIEVAETSRNIDLGNKLSDYQRAGVLEYVVVASDPDEVIWHVRRADRFLRVPPDADGVYRSQVFPGLWLDPQVLLADDVAALVAAFEKGLASAEHAAFVARLAAARRSV